MVHSMYMYIRGAGRTVQNKQSRSARTTQFAYNVRSAFEPETTATELLRMSPTQFSAEMLQSFLATILVMGIFIGNIATIVHSRCASIQGVGIYLVATRETDFNLSLGLLLGLRRRKRGGNCPPAPPPRSATD